MIKGAKAGRQKKGSDDIREPVNSGEKSEGHYGNKQNRQKDIYRRSHAAFIKKFPDKDNCGSKNTDRQHGVGGGIGCFKPLVEDHGSVVNDHDLEQSIESNHQHIKDSQKDDPYIDFLYALSFDKLHCTDCRKAKGNSDGSVSEKLGDAMEGGIVAEFLKESPVDSRQAHLRAFGSDRFYPDVLNNKCVCHKYNE